MIKKSDGPRRKRARAQEEVMAMWKYVCMSTTCGHVEFSTFAPAASKKCPECGGTMKREPA